VSLHHHFALSHLKQPAMADLALLRRWSTATATATTKLRDSCTACASSKVKCTKEKPTCSRCAKRGTTCDYLATKRPGRKQPPHPFDPTNTPPNINPTHAFDTFSWSTTLSGTTPTSSASPTAVPQPLTNRDSILPASSDLFHGLLDTSLFSDLDPMSNDFSDFFAPSVSFPLLPDPPDTDLLNTPLTIFGDQNGNNNTIHNTNRSTNHNTNQNGISNNNNNNSSKDTVEDTIYLFGSESPSRTQRGHLPVAPPAQPPAPSAYPTPRSSLTAPSIRPSTTRPTEHNKESNNGTPPCTCLTRTLDLLKLLVARNVSPQASSCDLAVEDQLATVGAVNALNKRTIDALTRILQCACSTDTYLLTIASLVVFRMLNGYAQVAHDTAAAHNVDDDGEDLGRVAAQLVLGELHLVQGLVNQLALRLRACVSRRPSRQDKFGFLNESPSPTRASDTSPDFFYPMLDQLEPELRSRIRSLSFEVIALLQRD
jgi:hypothetical protein